LEPVKKGIVTAMSIQMKAEIIAYGQGQIWGQLHSRYLETPYTFIDLIQMIHKMEQIFDTNGFPQAFLSPRTFKGGKAVKIRQIAESDDSMSQNEQSAPEGQKSTFEITVRFRQNATWQGQIFWAEKNVRQNFRSVLEMLKLMDEALNEGDGNVEKVDWGK